MIYATEHNGGILQLNINYAYDFDYINRGGWGLRIVNASDWVPETPFSLQTTRDFATVNPFTDVKKILKKQKFPVRKRS